MTENNIENLTNIELLIKIDVSDDKSAQSETSDEAKRRGLIT